MHKIEISNISELGINIKSQTKRDIKMDAVANNSNIHGSTSNIFKPLSQRSGVADTATFSIHNYHCFARQK